MGLALSKRLILTSVVIFAGWIVAPAPTLRAQSPAATTTVLRLFTVSVARCCPRWRRLGAACGRSDTATIVDLNAAFKAGTLTSEKLTELCLARIDAYDRRGPALRAMITVNPKALETARALDAERKAKGPRSPLHGIPVVLKDNFDTADMPTTGGSVMLEGSIPPDDAFVVKKLRAAGAVIIGKANLSEFASGGAYSSLGGQTLNPHDLTRSPGGFVRRYRGSRSRQPTRSSASAPTQAVRSAGLDRERHRRAEADARSAQPRRHHSARAQLRHRPARWRAASYDVAAVLGLMTGVDTADPATGKSEGHFETDYTKYLKPTRSRARESASRVTSSGRTRMSTGLWSRRSRRCGAPGRPSSTCGIRVAARRQRRVLQRDSASGIHGADRAIPRDARPELSEEDRISSSNAPSTSTARAAMAPVRIPRRWTLFKREAESGTLDDYRTRRCAITGCRWCVRPSTVSSRRRSSTPSSIRPRLDDRDSSPTASRAATRRIGARVRRTNIANLTGFPDLIVPAGFTGDVCRSLCRFSVRRSARQGCWRSATASSKRRTARRLPRCRRRR